MRVSDERDEIKNEMPEFETLEAGIYDFEIIGIHDSINEKTHWGPKDILHIFIGCLHPDNRGHLINYKISRAFSSGYEGGSVSHLFNLAKAVFKKMLTDDEAIKINELIGGSFQGRIELATGKKGNRVFENIKGVDRVSDDAVALNDEEKAEALKRAEKWVSKIQTGGQIDSENAEDDYDESEDVTNNTSEEDRQAEVEGKKKDDGNIDW